MASGVGYYEALPFLAFASSGEETDPEIRSSGPKSDDRPLERAWKSDRGRLREPRWVPSERVKDRLTSQSEIMICRQITLKYIQAALVFQDIQVG
ncbi:uncharacterized protein RAG0_14022 [Rhynchosporium agropyri]|uniref:Uncharacterized protein n=1 Tax=Rhynchosporium agropyri TaxID=914238 RepID=A0A1E1LF48_9HELO|nr:uncharacterized protein RAG0_14022 [Rhynchosporium agropyri]